MSPDTYTIIIPAFNEEAALGPVLEKLKSLPNCAEIIVVDDGSRDQTAELAHKQGVTVVSHGVNRGYGAALKSGIRLAKTPLVVWCDADGQHDPEDILKIIEPVAKRGFDAALGTREEGSAFDVKRMPGKFILKLISQIVARRKIPDLNCGLRCFKSDIIKRYLHLFPEGFSASSTTTLVMIKRGYNTIFVPIKSKKRVGSASTVKMFRDGFKTIALLLRITILFDSFFFFTVLSGVQLCAGGIYSLQQIIAEKTGTPVLGAIVIISGILTFFMGILASMINELRLAMFEAFYGNKS